MLDEGVEFASDRSLWFNVHYVANVMIDPFYSQSELLDKAADLSPEELKEWRASSFGI